MSRRRAPRSAAAIGRTALGPRAVPDLMRVHRTRVPVADSAVLDNGLQVVAVRRPGAPLVEVRLRIPFGGATAKQAGQHAARAELLSATTMLGTASRDREQVDVALSDVGAQLYASVDPQRLLYTGSVLANGLPTLLELLGEVLTTAAYRSADVGGERDRLVEHLALSMSEPAVTARIALQRKRFGDHPAAHEMPEPGLVSVVGPAAIRGLHHRSVVPAGSTLVLVGDLSPRKTIETVAGALSGWVSLRRALVLTTPPAVTGSDLEALHRNGSVQSQVRLTAAAAGRTSPDYAALQVTNLIYAGYFSSRLVENIREDKGYTYHAGSGIEFWPGSAALTVSFDTNTESTAPALLEARYELGRMALSPPTPAEVESARNYALGTLAISLATQAGYASTLSSIHGAGLDVEWLRTHPARLAAVTVDDVADVAARYLAPSRFTGVIQGNLDAIAGGLRSIGGVQLP
ncbi:MAG: insulinase family protein [Actinomycetota bacterium]|nr:insulinase family protein [Actinomycetota bacterium]